MVYENEMLRKDLINFKDKEKKEMEVQTDHVEFEHQSKYSNWKRHKDHKKEREQEEREETQEDDLNSSPTRFKGELDFLRDLNFCDS